MSSSPIDRAGPRRRHRPALLAALAVVVLLVAPHSRAQTLGFKGGVSVSSASFDSSETFRSENRSGFVGGIFLNAGLGPLSFQPELSYSRQGFGQEGATEGLELEYLTGTALLKLGLPLPVIKPSVFGGISYGLETGCDLFGQDCDAGGFDTRSTELSGVVGADLVISLGAASLWGDGRYSLGLAEIEGASEVFRDLKLRRWQFQVGIGFKLNP